MKSITTTRLRRDLFSILDEVETGEPVEITRHGVAVAVLSPVEADDWRRKVRYTPRLLVDSERAFAPLDDVWESYQ